MTKEEFLDWKQDYRTQEVFSYVKDRLDMRIEYLVEAAAESKEKAAMYAGAILAYRELLEMTYDEESHGN